MLKSYLISVCVIVFIMAVIDLILPNKNMSKLLKMISMLLIFSITIVPLIENIKNVESFQLDLESVVGQQSDDFFESQKKLQEQLLQDKLKIEFGENVEVSINYAEIKGQIKTKSVAIIIDKNYLQKDENMEYIKQCVIAAVDVEKEKVYVYGR